MINSIIYVFHTHLEITNITDSELFQLKKRYSKWDETYHRYEPISYYYENGVLYLPRGTDIDKLMALLYTRNVIYGKREDKPHTIPVYQFNGLPKSTIQADATNFLLGVEKFNNECRKSVRENEDAFTKLTNKMGQFIDVDNLYLTYKNDYIEN